MPDNSIGQRKTTNQERSAKPNLLNRFFYIIDRHPLYMLGLILIIGLLVSLVVTMVTPPLLTSGENETWWNIILNLIQGHGYSLCIPRYFPFCGPANQITAMREPLPVFVFAGVALLSGESLWAATFVELIIFLAVLVAIYFLTHEWTKDSRPALLAAFLWAGYIPAIRRITQVSGDLLGALAVTIGILFTMRARHSNRARDWLIAGIGFGLGINSRSAILFIPIILIGGQMFELWAGYIQLQNFARSVSILSGVVLLIMAPWLIRNSIVLGSPVIGSSLVGYNLYRHNAIIGSENYLRYVGADEALTETQMLVANRPDLSGLENEGQMNRVYLDESLKVIKAYPVRYLLLSAYRFFPLWFNWGYAEAYGQPTSIKGYIVMVLQALLLILTIIGIRENFRNTWSLWGSIAIISLAHMAVNSQLLYLIPVMPIVISLSGAGGCYLLNKLSRIRRRKQASHHPA